MQLVKGNIYNVILDEDFLGEIVGDRLGTHLRGWESGETMNFNTAINLKMSRQVTLCHSLSHCTRSMARGSTKITFSTFLPIEDAGMIRLWREWTDAIYSCYTT